MRSVGR